MCVIFLHYTAPCRDIITRFPRDTLQPYPLIVRTSIIFKTWRTIRIIIMIFTIMIFIVRHSDHLHLHVLYSVRTSAVGHIASPQAHRRIRKTLSGNTGPCSGKVRRLEKNSQGCEIDTFSRLLEEGLYNYSELTCYERSQVEPCNLPLHQDSLPSPSVSVRGCSAITQFRNEALRRPIDQCMSSQSVRCPWMALQTGLSRSRTRRGERLLQALQ